MLNQEKSISDFKGLTFCSESNEVIKYSKQIDEIIHLIKKNPKAVELLRDALKDGPIKIQINPAGTLDWPAKWYGDSRTINLGISISKSKDIPYFLFCVLFELSNSVNPFFKAGTKESALLSIGVHKDAESYARMSELAEHGTQGRIREVYAHAQKNKLWARNLFKYSNKLANSFPQTWEMVNKKQDKSFSHTDIYRQHYIETTAHFKELEKRLAELEKSNAQFQALLVKSQKDSDETPPQSPKGKKK